MAASQFLDGCRFNPTLGGTTDWTYSSAATGYNTPTLAGAVTATQYSIRAESADLSQWEISQGNCTITAGVPTFARTTVLYNSSGTGTAAGQSGAGTKISFSTVPTVAVVALKEDLGTIQSIIAGFGLSGGTITTLGTLAVSLPSWSAILGSDIANITTNTWTQALSVAQGTTGTFIAFGQLTIVDSSGASAIHAELTDGTTTFSSGNEVTFSAGNGASVSIFGIITNPAGNIRINGMDTTAGNHGTIKANLTGGAADTLLFVVRIA